MYLPLKLFKFILCTNFLINSISCYVPLERRGHNSILIGDRLIIVGGLKNVPAYELCYLDLSKPFDNNTNIPWTLIRNGDLTVATYYAASFASLDNSIIFLIGGYLFNKDQSDSTQVFKYDISTSKWTTPTISGDAIPPRQRMKGVIDGSGIAYIFGGSNISFYNDMNTFDTNSLTWKTLSVFQNLPTPCRSYTANLLPNGIIVYIGGQEGPDEANSTLVNIKKASKLNMNY